MISRFLAATLAVLSTVALVGCQGLVRGVDSLDVNLAGAGFGAVTSAPNGISCANPSTSGSACQATFKGVPQVVLTAAPATGFGFGGWSGCKSTSGMTCTVSGAATVTATFTASLQSINHIIFLAQENRSFDSYFGAMRGYWANNSFGFKDQTFDGLPQFNPPANSGLTPSNPGCDPAQPSPQFCTADGNGTPIQSFQFNTMCVENPSPSWNEAHSDWNVGAPTSSTASLDGFVQAAANDARQHQVNGVVQPFFDVSGKRAMGYYTGSDLNYYYFMASSFATSDAWFSPVMTRTPPNRDYLIAGTSQGYVYPQGTNAADGTRHTATTIFQALQNAGITWKIYIPTQGTPCASNPVASCLIKYTYLQDFTFASTVVSTYPQNLVPADQFITDAQNGTLPQVAQIEPGSVAGLDEHPSDDDVTPACCSVQAGASYVSSLINALMNSSSWSTSAFILTWDEFGGFYDHVAPIQTVSPDGIKPVDLFPTDTCAGNTSPICDFQYTGFRVPMIVISPFAKKNFVSHQARDYTAILKLIESRFGLGNLTKRDQAQVDMTDPTTGFFDFTNGSWQTPPSNVPAQDTSGACYLNQLP